MQLTMPSLGQQRPSWPLVVGGIVVVGGLAMYAYARRVDAALRKEVKLVYTQFGPFDKPNAPKNLPPDAVTNPRARVLSDRFQVIVPRDTLPSGMPLSELLTEFMRLGLSGFANLPQGKMFQRMHRGTPANDHTFITPEAIMTSGMEVGDVILGAYEVIRRCSSEDDSEAVAEVGSYGDVGTLNGNMGCTLVYILTRVDGEGDDHAARVDAGGSMVSFETLTVMWDAKDITTARSVPLRVPLNRWFHEITAMKLLRDGVKTLQERAST